MEINTVFIMDDTLEMLVKINRKSFFRVAVSSKYKLFKKRFLKIFNLINYYKTLVITNFSFR